MGIFAPCAPCREIAGNGLGRCAHEPPFAAPESSPGPFSLAVITSAYQTTPGKCQGGSAKTIDLRRTPGCDGREDRGTRCSPSWPFGTHDGGAHSSGHPHCIGRGRIGRVDLQLRNLGCRGLSGRGKQRIRSWRAGRCGHHARTPVLPKAAPIGPPQ
jgi:hypothetical protein